MGNYTGTEDTMMSKRDGIYRMEQSHNMDLFMKKIGITDADTKLMTSPRNICTLSLMRNKDGSFSLVHHSTLAPHLKMDITAKVRFIGSARMFVTCYIYHSSRLGRSRILRSPSPSLCSGRRRLTLSHILGCMYFLQS